MSADKNDKDRRLRPLPPRAEPMHARAGKVPEGPLEGSLPPRAKPVFGESGSPPGRPSGTSPPRLPKPARDERLSEKEGASQAVRVVRLSKFYGTLQALRQVSFDVERGDIYGLIGPNGAGKTTILKVLATLIYPNYGSAYIYGRPVSTGSRMIRSLIGYMPDAFGYYEEFTAEEYLQFYAAMYHMRAADKRNIIRDVLETTDLMHKRDATVSRLSRGMQQRLQVARLLLHDPEVLLLDEPASGLDPRARIDLKDLLRRLTDRGKTVIISSHVLGDLQGFVGKLGIIEQGRMLFTGTVENLTMNLAGEKRYVVRVSGDVAGAVELLGRDEAVTTSEAEDAKITFRVKKDGPGPGRYARLLAQNGYPVLGLKEKGLDLQDAFLMVTKGVVS